MGVRSEVFSIILRTCHLISPKYPANSTLYENKKFHFSNIKRYAKNNKASLYVICDTNDDKYFDFCLKFFGSNAKVFLSRECSNEGSFAQQINLALKLNCEFIEIAEDDFLKKGTINFEDINKQRFYTAYRHPLSDRIVKKFLIKIFDNEFTTVCSFLCSKKLLLKHAKTFLKFGEKSDAMTWRAISTPWFLELIMNIKIRKIDFCFGPKNKISRIDGVTWVHIASDSLPRDYLHYRQLSFKKLKKLWDAEYEK